MESIVAPSRAFGSGQGGRNRPAEGRLQRGVSRTLDVSVDVSLEMKDSMEAREWELGSRRGGVVERELPEGSWSGPALSDARVAQ